MKLIDEILAVVNEDIGAMIVDPASAEDLKLCREDMAEMEFPPIPQAYADFLSKLNGFVWNSIEFYSTDQVTDLDTGYMLNDIVTANENFTAQNEGYGLEHCVYLGRADEDLFVYNTKNAKYEILDFTGRDVMEEYDTFEAMFAGVIEPRL
jgi:hypothetical protein